MFFMRIVGMTKVIEYGERFHESLDEFLSERRDARCDQRLAAK